VSTTGYAEHNEFEFVWQTETGKERRTSARPSNGTITFVVNDICKFVSFRPPARFFSQTQIQAVRIEGIKREDVSSALDSLSNLDGLKQSIIDVADKVVAKADQKIAEAAQAEVVRQNIAREVATLKQNASRARKNVDDLAHKKNELITENGEATRALDDSNSRFRDVQQRTQLLEKQSAKLASDVQTNEATLKSLKSNINLFPTEIVEFVNQGSKNLRQYFWLAVAPIAIIGIMFFLLIRGAADLTTVITDNPNVNIQAILVSRAPYVTIALAIITACYKIARAFFTEMIRINSQRLNLTKISIIAKDVSFASEHELNLSDEDRYRLRTELKMALLKDHLKDYISRDFQVQLPRRIVGALGFGDDKVKVHVTEADKE